VAAAVGWGLDAQLAEFARRTKAWATERRTALRKGAAA
jgi:hypothetical protein